MRRIPPPYVEADVPIPIPSNTAAPTTFRTSSWKEFVLIPIFANKPSPPLTSISAIGVLVLIPIEAPEDNIIFEDTFKL